MDRITDAMLESLVERLNQVSKSRYQIGHSYGMVHLEKKSMECTGISTISQGNTKKELYYQISTLLTWLNHEKTQKQDYVKNCTHHDVFNIHHLKENQKEDASLIHEYHGKYECITCGKNFTKKEFDESHKPRSREELSKMRYEN